MRNNLPCALSFCNNFVFSAENEKFCSQCRTDYSPKALTLMNYFGVPLGEALVKAAKLFHSAQGISDYFGVSLPTLYAWVRTYHGLSFRQFKRKFICPSRSCIVVDHCSAHYAWKYTVADRVHDRSGCICFVEGSENLVMTTLSPSSMSEILHAEVGIDYDTGIYVLRYPVRTSKLCTAPSQDEPVRSKRCGQRCSASKR